ncbi:MAG TPA: sodium:proton antiporter [Rhodospirillaceae bacterium]|nr:sodium:proton antiporter [Rhodospirillaceae bacterium]
MPTEHLGLFSTLVVSLVAAFTGGLAVRTLKLPPLLGYILAGVMIGPFTPGLIANQAIASELAEIGVALLLFNIGLHFSFQDLLSIRKIALPGALIQVILTTAGGAFLANHMMDMSLGASLVIGLSLAIASTAVATRVFEEHKQTAALAGRIALGWLVVQDVIVIIALVLLPVLGNESNVDTQHFLKAFGKTLLQVTGFAAVMIVAGRRAIPALLRYVARIGSRELFTLAVIVVALGIAYGSSVLFGVSLAMGAFFAGVVIGESDFNYHAASEALSMQQIFTILFFVSVGMLFDPRIIMDMPLEIITFLATVILGTGVLTFAFLVYMDVPLRTAGLVGGAFAQIGEFSFVLSEIGFKESLFEAQERDLIMAVAFLSILINPLLLALAMRTARWAKETPLLTQWRDHRIEKNLPEAHLLNNHVILVGHGRVGGVVAKALREQNVTYVIIESNRSLAEKLRRDGQHVIYGDATREAVCGAAVPQQAKLMIIAVQDELYTKQAVRQAYKLNPNIDIVVRTHSDKEARALNKLGVGFAVMGEREIGFGMATYALFRLDLSPEHALETIARIRENVYGLDKVTE